MVSGIRRPARLAARALLLPLLGAAAPVACQSASPGRPVPPSDVVAFVDVTVIPMDRERTVPGQTVVVRDGRISQISAAGTVELPAGARVVDGRGKYLMPGLAEMHAHTPTPQGGMEAIDRTLFLYLAGGVTTIRGMLGHPAHLELRERSARDEILAPRIFTSGPSFSGGSMTPESAARLVREQKEAGYDFLKLHPGLSRAAFDAIDSVGAQVGMAFAGHVPGEVGLLRALEARYASIDHLDGYVEALAGQAQRYDPATAGFFGFDLTDRVDTSRIPALAAATRRAGVWNVPTQSLLEHLASPLAPERMAEWPEMRYMPAQTVAQWVKRKHDFQSAAGFTPERARRYIEIRRGIIKALHDAGAGLLLGSDAPQWWNVPGFSARRELEYVVASGLTPYEALETGTRQPAVYFGEQDEWGTVEPGKVADLILLEADPLQDIRNLWRQAGVMVRGRWLPQSEIERRLEEIAEQVR